MKTALRSRPAQIMYLAATCLFVVVFWIWRVRSPNAPLFSATTWAEVYNWGHRLTSLGWIADYQTLIGGVLALLAGAFVLWAAASDIRERRADQKRDRVDRIVGALNIVAAQFLTVETIFEISSPHRKIASPVPTIIAAATELSRNYPVYYIMLTVSVADIENAFRLLEAQRSGSPIETDYDKDEMLAALHVRSVAMRHYALDLAKLLANGGDTSVVQVSSESTRAELKNLGLDEKHLGILRELYTDLPAAT